MRVNNMSSIATLMVATSSRAVVTAFSTTTRSTVPKVAALVSFPAVPTVAAVAAVNPNPVATAPGPLPLPPSSVSSLIKLFFYKVW